MDLRRDEAEAASVHIRDDHGVPGAHGPQRGEVRGVVVPRDHQIVQIEGAAVPAGGDAQTIVAPVGKDRQLQLQRRDLKHGHVGLAVDLPLGHLPVGVQDIIRDQHLSGRRVIRRRRGLRKDRLQLLRRFRGHAAGAAAVEAVVGRQAQGRQEQQRPEDDAGASLTIALHRFCGVFSDRRSAGSGPPPPAAARATRADRSGADDPSGRRASPDPWADCPTAPGCWSG